MGTPDGLGSVRANASASALADVDSVVVFRALMLGDLLCATPALRALRKGLPGARIALVGLRWARPLVQRLSSVDEFIEFPGWPGLPETEPPDDAARHRFLQSMQVRRFDLAVQLHGSGGIVNEMLAGFGARRMAGYASDGAWCPPADAARFTAWPTQGSEVERLLALTDHLGLPRDGARLDFPLRDADHAEVAERWPALRASPYALVHAGSQLPSRRWPPERFAAVADRLADAGATIVLTGSATEAPLTRAVARAMRHPALDLSAQTTLWTLGALVARAAVVTCNDTGISHIAAALGTPSVVVASGSDVPRWAPADAARHAVFWHDLPCRPCGHAICPNAQACARAVPDDAVAEVAVATLRGEPRSVTAARPQPAPERLEASIPAGASA